MPQMLTRVTVYVTIYWAVCTMRVHCDDLPGVYTLHSKPGLPKVVYLDFGGNNLNLDETCWGTGGVCGPVNYERQRVEYIWSVVAEAYSPFEVDITTEYVGGNNDFILRSNASDEKYGIRVLFSPCAVPLLPDKGGVTGYAGIYDRIDDQRECPILMNTNVLNPCKCFLARAATHEVGHAFGLSHMRYRSPDGNTFQEYYEGIPPPPGCLSWAPVMGNCYITNLMRFSNGEYPGFLHGNSDALAVMATFVPYTPDDAPNTAPGLDLQIGPNLTYTFKGCISNSADQDWFRVGAAAGTMSVTVSVAWPTSPLDIDLTLTQDSTSVGTLQKTFLRGPTWPYYDSFGPTVVSYDVSTAGYFDIIVKGQGCGTGATGGYNAYGSIGTYTLTILVTAPWSPTTTTPAQTTTPTPNTNTAQTTTPTPNTTTAQTTTPTPNTTTAQTTTPTPTPTPTVTPTSSTALYATAAAVAGMLVLSVVAFTLL